MNDHNEDKTTVGGVARQESDPRIGKRIGDFEILRCLGRGGMGTVFEAYQESMRRKVALKILDALPTLSRSDVARFEREAWILGRLVHPGVVKVFSQGVVDQVHYIAMELIKGSSLKDEIERLRAEREGKPTTDSAGSTTHVRRMVALFGSAAEALEYVHKQGVVHRDIKPGNLLLSESGDRLLLTDFGLARDDQAVTALTQRGDFLGTVRYMSPEQLLAQRINVDFRTDIWSLGVSLYEALTLTLPYRGDSQEAYIGEVAMRDPIPVRQISRLVPRDIETVLMRCLQRDPQQRFQSAEQLRADLQRVLEGAPVQAKRPGVVRKIRAFVRRNHKGILVGLMIGMFVTTTMLILSDRLPDRTERASVAMGPPSSDPGQILAAESTGDALPEPEMPPTEPAPAPAQEPVPLPPPTPPPAATGSLVLDLPERLEVYIGGRRVHTGRGQVTLDVEPDTPHTVEVRNRDEHARVQLGTFRVEPGQTRQLDPVRLQYGTLTVNANAEVTVRLGGSVVAEAVRDIAGMRVGSGRHELTVTAPEGYRVDRAIYRTAEGRRETLERTGGDDRAPRYSIQVPVGGELTLGFILREQ